MNTQAQLSPREQAQKYVEAVAKQAWDGVDAALGESIQAMKTAEDLPELVFPAKSLLSEIGGLIRSSKTRTFLLSRRKRQCAQLFNQFLEAAAIFADTKAEEISATVSIRADVLYENFREDFQVFRNGYEIRAEFL
jgi:hypothetical protein